jgi:hypothetical protein
MHKDVAIAPSGQKAVFDRGAGAKLLDQEQTDDQQQQDHDDTHQPGSLPLGRLKLCIARLPVPTWVHATLHALGKRYSKAKDATLKENPTQGR